MEREELLQQLVSLARESGIAVRSDGAVRGAEGETGPRSGLCRLRGEPLLVLLASDGLEDRIAAAAEALRQIAPDLLEGRYLPPAVREALEGGLRPPAAPAGGPGRPG
jgi:hypothetical protein